MTTSSTPHPSGGRSTPFRPLSLLAAAVAVSLAMLVALASTSVRTAGATEFYSNPSLSPIYSCTGGEYHYQLGLYNLAANDSTVFTVEVTPMGGSTQTTVHTILGGDQEWVDVLIPEATTTTIHVTNDDDATIDWTASPTADCVADPLTQLSIVCSGDGTSATLRYDWVNTSYTPAEFVLHLPDASTQQSTIAWSDHDQFLEVPVAEGEHLQVSISTDGVTTSALDSTVDCVDDTTTTSTLPTPPTTTPPTTVPPTTTPTTTVAGSTPSTEAPVVLGADEVFGDELLDPAMADLHRSVDTPETLAFTGAETGWLAAIGTLLLAAGLVSWTAARRRRSAATRA